MMEIDRFLAGPTPMEWVPSACDNVEILLLDHANCERKAASYALSLIYRYAVDTELTKQLSKLAREEMRHFELVVELIEREGLDYRPISPSRYASALNREVSTHEPERFVDSLLVAALIEARSCERFELLRNRLTGDARKLYSQLLHSEKRHFETYYKFACERHDEDLVLERLKPLRDVEYRLASEPDTEFRFHSGPLAKGMHSSCIESSVRAIHAHRSQEPST